MDQEIHWKKSSYSNGETNCIELADDVATILMRESDNPGTIMATSRDSLRALIFGIKAGEFDHLI
jgi:hypothetical protein